MQVRTYEDKQGKTVWVTEVIGNRIEFLERKGTGTGQNQGQTAAPPPQQSQQPPQPKYQQQNAFRQDGFSNMGTQVPFDEEVPF